MEQYEIIRTLDHALSLVKKTGKFILKELGKVEQRQVENKALNSLVSYVDKEAEKMLVEGLQQILPSSTFITEENTVISRKSNQTWIIDPLDGTTNFLHGIPHFSVSVALMIDEVLQIGIVYAPSLDECFYAGKGIGAFLNGRPIQVSTNTSLSAALIATGFPYDNDAQVERILEFIRAVKPLTRGVRRFGSAALDLAYTAVGRLDAYFEDCLNAWDVAAGILIVQEAGGEVSDVQGGNDYLFSGNVLAATPEIHEQLRPIIGRIYTSTSL